MNRLFCQRAGASLLAAGTLAFSGCSREEVRVYQAPKEKLPAVTDATDPTAPPFMAAANPAKAAPARPRVTWTVPAGWEELPGNELRVGSFVVKGADQVRAEISVLPFPGAVGNEIDNVNRWRGQVGLEPITAAAVKAEDVALGGERGRLFEMAGTVAGAPTRLLAVNAAVQETSWFFKMMGDDALVTSQKKSFLEFLHSVRFASASAENSPATPAQAVTQTQPPPATETRPAATATSTGGLAVPAGWTKLPDSPMLQAKFSVPGGAESSISSFPGDVGGMLANVNRWRGQLGLDPVGNEALPKMTSPFDVLGGKGTLVDLTGGDGKTRLVAAVVPRDGKTWFFKLMGDSAVVGREREAFMRFVQTFQFSNGQ